MSYQIFVQNQLHNGYQAMVIGLPDCVAEGVTEEEAVAKAKEALSQWLARGKLVTFEFDPDTQAANPWQKICGKYKDDPTWDDFQANIAAYRRQLNEEEAAREAAAMS
ncbi:MAG: type II toxin-antitoxin system HicB family antitoxin [Acidobacteria bacterium]|nr:type II toxin-antitoxin system HicB family antitoxin [Acidobacteriota bacterium]MBI3426609.1 type II toxin-antitoxin system HicB family antitoxin [Acidobacteriota bacterium]